MHPGRPQGGSEAPLAAAAAASPIDRSVSRSQTSNGFDPVLVPKGGVAGRWGGGAPGEGGAAGRERAFASAGWACDAS